jgi:hypothetical protein
MGHSESGRPMSRRTWLGAAAAVIAGATGGVIVAVLQPDPVGGRPEGAPAWLRSAVEREGALLALLESTGRRNSALVPQLAPLRADHTAHLQALQAVAARYAAASAVAAPSATAAPGLGAVRAAEARAGEQAADAALLATGTDAALFASIAACEATHVEILSG